MSWVEIGIDCAQTLDGYVPKQSMKSNGRQREGLQYWVLQGQEKVLQGQEDSISKTKKKKRKIGKSSVRIAPRLTTISDYLPKGKTTGFSSSSSSSFFFFSSSGHGGRLGWSMHATNLVRFHLQIELIEPINILMMVMIRGLKKRKV